MSIGTHCPRCGHAYSHALNTRPSGDGVLRRRKCLNCGERYSTRERAGADPAVAALQRRLTAVNRAIHGDFDEEV